jgi:disulfide bond formation protein DsbB
MANLLHPRLSALVLLVASAAVLGSALMSQYIGDLEPCVLCVYQRVPYAAAISFAFVGLMMSGSHRAVAAVHCLATVAFLIGAAIAAYHVGVEQQWWAGTTECTGAAGSSAQSVDELRAQIMSAPTIRCDEVAWSLFGISMAGYNFLVSLVLAAFAVMAARANFQRETRSK